VQATTLPQKLLTIVIVKGFPEADPNIEQTQAAAQAAKESGWDQGTKPGIGKQKIVVGPLRGPGQNHEQDSGDGADEDEQEDRGAMQPELQPGVRSSFRIQRFRLQEAGNGLLGLRADGHGTAFDG